MSLTKTSAKGRSLKTKYVETLRSALDEYEHVYVLNYDNMRASHFKDVRADWKESRYLNPSYTHLLIFNQVISGKEFYRPNRPWTHS